MTIHFLNFSHDLALARNSERYTAPPNVQIMERNLAPLAGLLPQAAVAYHPLAPVWGWNRSMVNALRAAGYADLPTAEQLADIRRLSSRRTAVEMLPALRRVLPAKQTTGESWFAADLAVAEALIRDLGVALLKEPLSGSGRGLRLVREALTEQQRNWVRRCLGEQGGVVVEPYYNKVADFALEFLVSEGGAVFLGLSVFETNANNVYACNVIAPQQVLRQRISKVVPMIDIELIIEAVEGEICSRFVGWYLGPVGVDMMVVEEEGELKVHPCVEVNVRRTMGELSLHMLPLLGEGVEGFFRIIYDRDSGALRRTVGGMPAAVYDGSGKLVSGTMLLTPLHADSHYVAVVGCDGTRKKARARKI